MNCVYAMMICSLLPHSLHPTPIGHFLLETHTCMMLLPWILQIQWTAAHARRLLNTFTRPPHRPLPANWSEPVKAVALVQLCLRTDVPVRAKLNLQNHLYHLGYASDVSVSCHFTISYHTKTDSISS